VTTTVKDDDGASLFQLDSIPIKAVPIPSESFQLGARIVLDTRRAKREEKGTARGEAGEGRKVKGSKII